MLRALSLCTCCRQYPGAAAGCRPRSSHPAVSAFPEIAVGSACTSTFSRIAQRSLALRPAHLRRHLYVTCYTEGFSHFVTSMTAPVASGWSGCRVGLAPTGKRRLVTAHANSGHCPTAWPTDQIVLNRDAMARRKSGVLSDALWSAPDAVSGVADCNPNIPNRRADATQHRCFFEPLTIRQRRFRFGVFRHGF